MRTKISKIANDLNVGVNTVVEYLRKHNIEVDSNPNARIDETAVELLYKEFSHDKAVKAKVEGKLNERRNDRQEKAEKRQQAPEAPQLKVVGKIDLEATKRPKPQEPKTTKPQEPKAAPVEEKKAAEAPKPTPKPDAEPKAAEKPAVPEASVKETPKQP